MRKKAKNPKKARPKPGLEPAQKYDMPANKRLFKLDAEIGRWPVDLPDAMTRTEILRHFGVSERQFRARAKKIAPVLKEFEKRQVMELLFEMGKERPEGKRK